MTYKDPLIIFNCGVLWMWMNHVTCKGNLIFLRHHWSSEMPSKTRGDPLPRSGVILVWNRMRWCSILVWLVFPAASTVELCVPAEAAWRAACDRPRYGLFASRKVLMCGCYGNPRPRAFSPLLQLLCTEGRILQISSDLHPRRSAGVHRLYCSTD